MAATQLICLSIQPDVAIEHSFFMDGFEKFFILFIEFFKNELLSSKGLKRPNTKSPMAV